MKVKILSHTPEPEKVISMAAKLCYSAVGVDQIEENDDVNERKFKVNTKDKELINKLNQFKIYDNIVLIFKITLYTSKMSMVLIDVSDNIEDID